MHMSVSATTLIYVLCGTHGGQKGGLDSLELELEMVINLVDAGNLIWVLYKSNKCFDYRAISPGCIYGVFYDKDNL